MLGVFQTSSIIGHTPIEDKLELSVFRKCRATRTRYTGAIAGSEPARRDCGRYACELLLLGKVS